MAQYGTGDLNAPVVLEVGAAEGQTPLALCERIEEAAHTAHATACHLRLLVAACTTQRDHPSFHLRTHSFSTGMQQLSECVRELEDQLDGLLILSDLQASREIQMCSSIAMYAAGLMQLIADATSEQWLNELELDINDFMGSIQDLADRMKRIEGCLEDVRRRQDGHG